MEYKKLMKEIAKIKFRNTSLITLVGLLNEGKMAEPTIYETVVTYDLSKKDLRKFTKLIQHFEGNKFVFEQKALKINPVFSQTNIISIIKSMTASGMLREKCSEILKAYESID